MIRSFLELLPKVGRADELVAFLQQHQILERSAAIEGCHSVDMSVSSDRSIVIVTGVWDDEEAYGRWISARSGDEDAATAEALYALLDHPPDPARIFTILHTATAPD